MLRRNLRARDARRRYVTERGGGGGGNIFGGGFCFCGSLLPACSSRFERGAGFVKVRLRFAFLHALLTQVHDSYTSLGGAWGEGNGGPRVREGSIQGWTGLRWTLLTFFLFCWGSFGLHTTLDYYYYYYFTPLHRT